MTGMFKIVNPKNKRVYKQGRFLSQSEIDIYIQQYASNAGKAGFAKVIAIDIIPDDRIDLTDFGYKNLNEVSTREQLKNLTLGVK